MEKRRVCVFCETWESGGIESFLTGVLLRQDLSEMEVDLVVAEIRASIYTDPLKAHGIRFVPLSGSCRGVVRNWTLFRALLRENAYDTVYLNVYQALSLRYALLAKRAGVPVRILHSHNTALRASFLRPLKLAVHRAARALYGGAGTAYFACSGAAGDFLFPARKRGELRFVPNGIETERFRFRSGVRTAARAELGLEDAFILGNIGRLCDQKNQMFLLDVLREILLLRPESRLILVGEGGMREALERRAAELGVRDRVVFYGVTDRPERLLCAFDVFLFPSVFEGLGIVAVEAQCAGLPVLCSEHVPAEAHVTDLAQKLPLSDGPGAWARAAAQCRAASRERYAQEVRAAGFDVDDVSRSIRDALMDSCSASGGAPS